MLPDFKSTFRTIESYRYSITTGLLLLCTVPYFFPIGWDFVESTWLFAVGLLFFLSFGMILVRDIWPWLRSLLGFALSEGGKRKAALSILEKAKVQSQDGESGLPFRVEVEDDDVKNFITYNFEATECRVENDEIIITETGLTALKQYI